MPHLAFRGGRLIQWTSGEIANGGLPEVLFPLSLLMTRGETMGKKSDGKVLAQNKKASHDYFIEDTYEAGMVLTGTEIKSIRNGRANIGDAFATIRNGVS